MVMKELLVIKLSDDGQEVCETLYEPTTPIEKFIPSTNQATNALRLQLSQQQVLLQHQLY